jgi:hypothetical protein
MNTEEWRWFSTRFAVYGEQLQCVSEMLEMFLNVFGAIDKSPL